jgi:hypothetical protein
MIGRGRKSPRQHKLTCESCLEMFIGSGQRRFCDSCGCQRRKASKKASDSRLCRKARNDVYDISAEEIELRFAAAKDAIRRASRAA